MKKFFRFLDFARQKTWRTSLGMTRVLTVGIVCVLLTQLPLAMAGQKTWTGAGDTAEWSEDQNWQPDAAPTSSDDVTINAPGASVAPSETFDAKSITIGGSQTSTFTEGKFISGTVEPTTTSDVAVENRRRGKLILKGSAGTLKLKGKYKDSEESLADQPSLIFFVR